MSTSIKNPFKNAKLKAFVVFLFLASVFWVLTKFSKQDVASVVATINYVNVPEGSVLAPSNPKEISFNLASTRFEFLRYTIKKPEIIIDVTSFLNENTNQGKVDGVALEKLILNQVVGDGRITQLSSPELAITLERLNFKMVPVHAKVTIEYEVGFDALDAMEIKPDSVKITGTKKALDTIKFIETDKIVIQDISAEVIQEIPLNIWQDKSISVFPSVVVAKQNVAEYSQKIVMVPVTMINQPLGGSFKLLPASVKVAFNIPVDKFNNVSASDFRIVCDYRSRNEEDNFMIPIIKEQPDHITGIEMETKKIDLLLFK